MGRMVKFEDAKAICDIYNHYVRQCRYFFEERNVLEEEMRERIKVISSDYLWIVFEDDNQILD